MELAAEEVVFVGHDPQELSGAAMVGMQTAAINYPDGTRADAHLSSIEAIVRTDPDGLSRRGGGLVLPKRETMWQGGRYMSATPEAVKGPFDSAPVTGWRRMLRDTSIVGVSGMVCHALGAVTAVLFRMCLSPMEMGIWQTLKMILDYANFANLGISKGATREYTIARGRGTEAEAVRGLNCAFTVNTVSSLLYGGVPAALGIWLLVTSRTAAAWGAGLIAVGAMAVVSRYVTFHINLLRCRQAFDKTAWISGWEAVATLAVGGTCAFFFGFIGLLAGTLAVLGFSILLVRRFATIHFAWAWDGPEIRRLTAIGGPILLAGCAVTLFRSIDKMMILAYLPDGEFQLGCYSVALMIGAQVFGIGNLLATVMGPRYGEKFGHTGCRATVARMAMRATEMQGLLVGGVAAGAMIAAPPVLEFLLPAYRPGFDSVRWLVSGAVGLSLALPASQALVTIDRQRRVLLIVGLALAAAVAGNHWVLQAGSGIAQVAIVTAACYVLYWLGLSGEAFFRATSAREWLSHLATVTAIAFCPVLLASALAEPSSPAVASWIEISIAKGLLAGSAFLIGAFVLFRRMTEGRGGSFVDFVSSLLQGRAVDE